jgi:hypothetical protein
MYGDRLRDAIGLAKRWGHPVLARCLAVVAVAHRDRQLEAIERALRHALSVAGLDLPFPSPPAVEMESAYLSARFREIGQSVPASVIDTWHDGQRKAAEEQINARRLWKKRLRPADADQTPTAIAHMTPHKVDRLVRELQAVGCPVPSETIAMCTVEQYVEARQWLDRYHRWQHQQDRDSRGCHERGAEAASIALQVPGDRPEAPEFLRAHAKNDLPSPENKQAEKPVT